MQYLKSGQYFGITNQNTQYKGVRLTDTVYTLNYVDWHYHENPYFTFILTGGLIEKNKKETYYCGAGDLIFHNWDEPHANTKPNIFSRGFHIELNKVFLENFNFSIKDLQGNLKIENIDMKFGMYNIFKESKIQDDFSEMSIQLILLNILNQTKDNYIYKKTPHWLAKLKELLYDLQPDEITLEKLAFELNIHPVHLSREFSKYFQCTLGEYIRKLKVQKALSLMFEGRYSLTEIAFMAGFSDQSHFIRCFKSYHKSTPKELLSVIH